MYRGHQQHHQGGGGGGGGGGVDDDDDYGGAVGEKAYKVPDKDFYRKMMTTFGGVHNCLANKIADRCTRDRPVLQPHFSSLRYYYYYCDYDYYDYYYYYYYLSS